MHSGNEKDRKPPLFNVWKKGGEHVYLVYGIPGSIEMAKDVVFPG